MRLIFLHGINQDGRDPAAMKQEWKQDLEQGLNAPGALDPIDIELPYYGNALVEAAKLKNGPIAQGGGHDEDRELARFLAEGLEEQASAAGISARQITEEQERAVTPGEAVPEGFPMSRRINAIVSLFERISPFHGDIALKLLGQAHAYLKHPHVQQAVDKIVAPALDTGPAVLVAHSLGTVVAFRLLRKQALAGPPLPVSLFVTMGSPLGLATIQRAIQPQFSNPAGIDRWINLRDPADFITLNRSLEPPRFSGPIENVFEFGNPGADPHAIPGYLQHPVTARAIAQSLGL